MKKSTKKAKVPKTSKAIKPKVVEPAPGSLESIFKELQKLLVPYAPPFKPGGGSIDGRMDYHLVVPQSVVIQGSYGNKPTEIAMASLILQKDFVGFYFMPIYLNPELKKNLAPTLLKLLKGKTCFHVKSIDTQLIEDVTAALALGMKSFKDRDWV
jgi:hypothetical protein